MPTSRTHIETKQPRLIAHPNFFWQESSIPCERSAGGGVTRGNVDGRYRSRRNYGERRVLCPHDLRIVCADAKSCSAKIKVGERT